MCLAQFIVLTACRPSYLPSQLLTTIFGYLCLEDLCRCAMVRHPAAGWVDSCQLQPASGMICCGVQVAHTISM